MPSRFQASRLQRARLQRASGLRSSSSLSRRSRHNSSSRNDGRSPRLLHFFRWFLLANAVFQLLILLFNSSFASDNDNDDESKTQSQRGNVATATNALFPEPVQAVPAIAYPQQALSQQQQQPHSSHSHLHHPNPKKIQQQVGAGVPHFGPPTHRQKALAKWNRQKGTVSAMTNGNAGGSSTTAVDLNQIKSLLDHAKKRAEILAQQAKTPTETAPSALRGLKPQDSNLINSSNNNNIQQQQEPQAGDDNDDYDKKLVIIIPFRDSNSDNRSQGKGREQNLQQWLEYMADFIPSRRRQRTLIMVSEQSQEGIFNKGFAINAGFDYIQKSTTESSFHKYDYLVVHDVDQIPTAACHDCYKYRSQTTKLIQTTTRTDAVTGQQVERTLSKSNVGGAVMMTMETFEKANGYSNRLAGWGKDDDNMANRLQKLASRPYQVLSNGIFQGLPHDRVMGLDETPQFENNKAFALETKTGLADLKYNILGTTDYNVNGLHVKRIVVQPLMHYD